VIITINFKIQILMMTNLINSISIKIINQLKIILKNLN